MLMMRAVVGLYFLACVASGFAGPGCTIQPVSKCSDLCDRALLSPLVAAVTLTGVIGNFRCAGQTWQVGSRQLAPHTSIGTYNETTVQDNQHQAENQQKNFKEIFFLFKKRMKNVFFFFLKENLLLHSL